MPICRQDELLQEKKDIEAHLRDMDDQIQHTSNNSKADFIMRSEIDRLKQDLYVYGNMPKHRDMLTGFF